MVDLSRLPAYQRAFVGQLAARLREADPLIQVLLGPRQVGKTTGALQLHKLLGERRVHYCSVDDLGAADPSVWFLEQWSLAESKTGSDGVLILDEIQNLPGWSTHVKRAWDERRLRGSRLKLVLLGSASLELLTGASESLAGRYELLPVFHWSYAESHRHLNLSLEDHLRCGGYPRASAFLGDHERLRSYLRESIVEAVIGKDILNQSSVRKPALFKQCFYLVASYPAQVISYTKLLGQLQDRGNTDLVKHYLELYAQAYLLCSLENFSGSAQRRRASSPKLLLRAPALYAVDAMNSERRGHVFEAFVGAELCARTEAEVFYYRNSKGDEVDYVVRLETGELFAVEVKSGRPKGLSGLADFRRKYPKARAVVLTPDRSLDFSSDPLLFLKSAAI